MNNIKTRVKEYLNKQFEISKICYKLTCHLLQVESGIPKPYASGILIQAEQNHYIFTAGHVIDGDAVDNINIGIGKNTVVKVGGEWIGNKVTGSRNDDKIDIAILKLCNESVKKLSNANYAFLNIDRLGINHQVKNSPEYVALGFPATKSKYNSYKKHIHSSPLIYTTTPVQDTVYSQLNYNSNQNLIVIYNQKSVDYSTSNKITLPKPYGMSGGGLWYINPISESYLLVAIMTDYDKTHNVIISTRIDIFSDSPQTHLIFLVY